MYNNYILAKSSSNIDENRTGHNRRNRNDFENIAQQAEHCNINLRRDDRRDDESELFLTPEMRVFIAKKLGNDWKRLGIKLGDDDIEEEIEHINEDNRKLLDKSQAMLKYLHESGITDWKSLKVGLDKLPRKDIIRKFEQAWQQGDFG